ncbi:MAG TPA: baseplate J/gp47 family protein [Chloroflexota bacterium]|nr:baseplate J/gp47 family protein [Chloroflexota bacterium]
MALAAPAAALEASARTNRFGRSVLAEVRDLEIEAPAAEAPTTLPLALHLGLPEVAERIEHSTGTRIAIEESELAPTLRTRTALRTLRRRADKRGRQLVLQTSSREMRRLALSAGWETALAALTANRGHAGVATGITVSRTTDDRRLTTDNRGRADVLEHSGVREAVLGRLGVPAPVAAFVAAPLRRLPPSGLPFSAGRHSTGLQLPVSVERTVGRMAQPLSSSTAWALPAGGVFGALVLLLAWTLVPSATISVTPVVESWTADVPLVVDPALKKPDLAKGRIPGRVVAKEVADSLTAPATGKKTVPDSRASGEVIFLNRSDKPVSIPKGTVVLAGNVKFATQVDATVSPSRAAGSSQSFGMSTVKVAAVTGGVSGNVDRNQINKIEGPLSGPLSVQNNAPTRGGTERAITYVTEDDRKKLHEKLHKDLSDRMGQQLKGQLPVSEKESAVPWSGQNPSVVEAQFSKNVDEEAQSVTLTLKMRYAATVFENDAYNTSLAQLAGTKSGEVRPGLEIVKGSVQALPPEISGVVENGVVRLTGRVRGMAATRVDEASIRQNVANRPLAEAHTYLGSLAGITRYEMQQANTWFGRLPWLGWKIRVAAAPLAPAA